MKPYALNKTVIAATLMACAAALSPAQAQQQPLIVTFAGEMSDISCTPSIEGNPVQLPPISVADVPLVGDTAGERRFNINVYCNTTIQPGMDKKVKAYFYANHVTGGRLNLTSGTGSGWQYQLLPGEGDEVQLDVQTSPTPGDNAVDPGSKLMVDSTGTHIPYYVRYYRSSTAYNAGTGITTANVVLYWP